MSYSIELSEIAEMHLDNIIYNIVFCLKNPSAAKSVLDDFERVINKLYYVAESLPYCEDMTLLEKGYRKIHFEKHNYIVLYRVCDNCIQIDGIYHELEDYVKCFKTGL